MPNIIVTLEIAEADVAITKAAAEWFTNLTGKPTPKQLLAAMTKRIVVEYRERNEPPPPPAPPNIS